MSERTAAERVAAERKAQGLPATIADRDALKRAARMVAAVARPQTKPKRKREAS